MVYKKSWRTADVFTGIYNLSVDLLVDTKIDGVENQRATTTVISWQVKNGVTSHSVAEIPNVNINPGTIPGIDIETATFIWGQARWGLKDEQFDAIRASGTGKTLQVIVRQVDEQASGYQILALGTDMKIRKRARN